MVLRRIYTSVGEFHYIHTIPMRAPYDITNEMSRHSVRACDEQRSVITLLDTLLSHRRVSANRWRVPQLRSAIEDADAWPSAVGECKAVS